MPLRVPVFFVVAAASLTGLLISCAPSEPPGAVAQTASGGSTSGNATSADDALARDDAVADEVPTATFATSHGDFASYWYQGLAELNRYELDQSRYGASHPGEAVLVFVTEDFLVDEQVKHEFGDGDAVNVLKLNAYRRFYTGIYPYTIMTSTFTPVEGGIGAALKSTTSVIEWCGSAFMQFNRRDGGVEAQIRSYFQSEGDADMTLPDVMLEDELWARIRRDPTSLPTGSVELLPAAHHLRLLHRDTAAQPAEASLEELVSSDFSVGRHHRYTVAYSSGERSLAIYFESEFPHRILGWDETGRSVFGGSGTTRAVLTRSIMLDYWSRHGTDDGIYREALGLEF